MAGMNVADEDSLFDEGALFDMKANPSILLRDRYVEPPFSVLDRRGGAWLDRDRKWKALGIQSEVGRAGDLAYTTSHMEYAPSFGSETSIFSPTLCELMLRWYSSKGDTVLDPFAGGSVRGVVASALGRNYVGVELRQEQVDANRAQGDLGGGPRPMWVQGDSRAQLAEWAADPDNVGTTDFVLSCPPYAYLEKYSDDPADLSNMPYEDFLTAYRAIIAATAALVAEDRYLAWVVGDVRVKGRDGALVGLVADTVKAFQDAGLSLYNDHIILTPIGTAAVRAPKQFEASRKVCRVHEYALVFVKGDGKRAAKRLAEASE